MLLPQLKLHLLPLLLPLNHLSSSFSWQKRPHDGFPALLKLADLLRRENQNCEI
jgi:hypothetical protein